jgi:hypothetical protein
MKTQKFCQIILLLCICFGSMQTYAQWVLVSDGGTPSYAMKGGYESDGTILYIARIQYEGGTHIGKARANAREAFIPYGGKELISSPYELYTGKGRWMKVLDGKFPKGAVVGGNENNGTALFIARSFIEGGWHIGKVRVNATEAFIPYGGKEEIVSDFEILVR